MVPIPSIRSLTRQMRAAGVSEESVRKTIKKTTDILSEYRAT